MFEDGTYLELFNWTDVPPSSNAWADKSPGLIDFALTSLPPITAEALQEKIQDQLQAQKLSKLDAFYYDSPAAGGRTRKDGVPVKWKLSRPVPVEDRQCPSNNVSLSGHRNDFPFLCHDVTARNVRIPFDDQEKTFHPCGATGISAVELMFPESQYDEYAQL